MEIPLDYVLQHFYSYCKRPLYRKNEGTYNAECCICNEGTSSGSKRRLFYFPGEHYFYCFNCSRSWSEINWLQDVSGKQITEILKEIKDFIPNITPSKQPIECSQAHNSQDVQPIIPYDSVDLFNGHQCEYYKHKDVNVYNRILSAKEYCTQRRLDTAINKPKSIFFSLNDYVHANRLIIPFYNENNKIVSYQSRSINSSTHPKYLTKYGEKCFYGENNIDNNIPYIFVLEGPIDAMFIRNSIAIGGAKVTMKQNDFLQKHFDKKVIYIFDNDRNNLEMQKTVLKAIEQGKNIFIWPNELKRFKDINDVCCALKLDYVSDKFLIENTFNGIQAKIKYNLRDKS